MKKTISVTIGGLVFNVEEDGYQKLNTYLESLKAHFTALSYGAEVISDIESRIAEQFNAKISGQLQRAITSDEVEEVIKSIGKVEDFGGSTQQSSSTQSGKKLYRNSEDKVIAGVASGVAAYFGLDVTLVRVIFAVIVLAGGWGIILYILLWLMMPEAKSAGQKLEMQGLPVTIKQIEQTAKEKLAEVRSSGFLQNFFRFLGHVIKWFSRIITGIIGVALVFAAAVATFSVTFTSINLIFNRNSPYLDSPITGVFHGAEYFLVIILSFVIIVIPMLFLAVGGMSLIRWKQRFNGLIAGSLLVIWLATTAIGSVIAFNKVPEIRNAITEYQGQVETRVVPVSNFTKVHASDAVRVTLSQSSDPKQTSVTIVGHSRDLDRSEVSVSNGVLSINRKDNFRVCFFCFNDRFSVNIVVPTLDEVKASDAVTLTMTSFNTPKMLIDLSDASRATVDLNATETTLNIRDASTLTLTGKSKIVNAVVNDASRINAYDFPVEDAVYKATDASRAEINVTKTLDATASDASRITFKGNPQVVQQSASDASRIQSSQ